MTWDPGDKILMDGGGVRTVAGDVRGRWYPLSTLVCTNLAWLVCALLCIWAAWRGGFDDGWADGFQHVQEARDERTLCHGELSTCASNLEGLQEVADSACGIIHRAHRVPPRHWACLDVPGRPEDTGALMCHCAINGEKVACDSERWARHVLRPEDAGAPVWVVRGPSLVVTIPTTIAGLIRMCEPGEYGACRDARFDGGITVYGTPVDQSHVTSGGYCMGQVGAAACGLDPTTVAP